MSMPFYASAEQIMRDRSEYARKNVARGRGVVVLKYPDGILLVAENTSNTLHKISEIYFAGAPNSNFFVDISAAMDQKVASLRAHDSQLGEHFDELEKWIREWTAEAGKKHDVEYAEEFHRAVNR